VAWESNPRRICPRSPRSERSVQVAHDYGPFEIEHFLMLRNRMHFGQAQGTPFTVPPLSDNLNWTASTPSAEAILQDTFISPPEISEICLQMISACQATTLLDQLPATITLEAFAVWATPRTIQGAVRSKYLHGMRRRFGSRGL
jgi:hypothetical protein